MVAGPQGSATFFACAKTTGTAAGNAGPILHENSSIRDGDRFLRNSGVYYGRSAAAGREGRADALRSRRSQGVHGICRIQNQDRTRHLHLQLTLNVTSMAAVMLSL